MRVAWSWVVVAGQLALAAAMCACGGGPRSASDTTPTANTVAPEPLLLRFRPTVGMVWRMEGRTHMDLGMGPMDGSLSCSTTVRSVEDGVVELASVGCVAAMANTEMVGAPSTAMPDVVEQYDALGRSLPGPHQRLGFPTLITFPEAPIRPGDRWTAAPALAGMESSPSFPSMVEYVLEEVLDGQAVIRAHTTYPSMGPLVATLDVHAVLDLSTGLFVSYEMTAAIRDPSDASQTGTVIGFEMITTRLH